MKRIGAAILFIFISLHAYCAEWDLGQNGNVSLFDFKSCGYDDQNQLAWQIMGRKASVRGAITTIEGCKLVFFHQQGKKENTAFIKPDESGKIRLLLETHSCDFNYAMGEVKSDQPITITLGNDVSMSGVGFDVDIARHVILLRSTVNLKLKLDKKTQKALKIGPLK
ncbi:MAG: LPS export ABC transporter periplasmic protein LptC [Victivallales bacterium]|nr:LPS export ABC transporter periplasmic protein LptC [Victivallales bacterium]